MSWAEKIERHRAEQRLAEQAAVELERQEDEAETRSRREKIRSLHGVLKELHAEELLTQIRNEIFPFMEVITDPDVDTVSSQTPISAKAILQATWLVYEDGYPTGQGPSSESCEYPEALFLRHDSLSAKAFYSEKREILINVVTNNSSGTRKPFLLGTDMVKARAFLVRDLSEELIFFEAVVSRSKKEAEDKEGEMVKHIARGVLGWENAQAYLLEKARKIKPEMKVVAGKPKEKTLWQRLLS